MSIDERIDSILAYIESKSNSLGSRIHYSAIFGLYIAADIAEEDRTYCDLLVHSECIGQNDLFYLLSYLEQQELIENSHRNDQIKGCALTVKGYARLDRIRKTPSTSQRAFVAMWFDDAMAEAWERGINPAIREAGYEPVRIDKVEHINKIDDEIISEIRKARFVVADFTHGKRGARGGVYYEAGFARGFKYSCYFNVSEKCHHESSLRYTPIQSHTVGGSRGLERSVAKSNWSSNWSRAITEQVSYCALRKVAVRIVE